MNEETKVKSENQAEVSTNEQIDRVEFIRFLLSLTEKLDKQRLELVSMTLCYELIRPTGICNLINASIDLDESSQKVTTLNQRFMKLSLIIAGLPKLCCRLDTFYESVCDQLIRILLNTTDERREESQLIKLINTLIVTICCALYRRNRRLFGNKFLQVIYNCFFFEEKSNQTDDKQANSRNEDAKEFNNELEQVFLKQLKTDCKPPTNHKSINEKFKLETINEINESNDDNTTASSSTSTADTASSTNAQSNKFDQTDRLIKLKIDESIKITLLLLTNHFEKSELVKYFKQFFYIKCVLNELDCSLNRNLDKLLSESLINIKNSEYLLDKTLFEEQSINEFDKYRLLLDVERGLKTVVLKSPDSINKLESNEVELKKIDQITQCTVKLVCSRSDAYKIDTFLLFLQRYSQKRTVDHQSSLLVCSLIDTLMKNIITPEGLIMLINFPEKAIDFVNLTLERLTLSYDTNIYELSTSTQSTDDDDELKNSIKEDSLNMCLQIIDFVLKKQVGFQILNTKIV